MPDLAALTRDERLIPAAIEAAAASGDDLLAALDDASDDATRAALAIALGLRGDAAAVEALLALADDDTLAARAAGWALGRCAEQARLVTVANEGGLDLREQAYRALAGVAARGRATPELAAAMRQRIEVELGRAAKGLTSLAEHATRVLAVLGAEGTAAEIQRVIAADPLADRYELERQRKQVEAEGRDLETVKELSGAWTLPFADQLAPAEQPAPKPAAAKAGGAKAGGAKADGGAPAPGALAEADFELVDPEGEIEDELAAEDGLDAEEGEAQPVDWQAFAQSPECSALDQNLQQLAKQFGPMLEQLVAQVARLPLSALTGQELAGLLLQVLPQAAPPQVVNAALSPQGLKAIQAIAAFLARSGAAIHGADLVDGVKLVRQTMREQLRASGMLGGPDYSDPDEAAG